MCNKIPTFDEIGKFNCPEKVKWINYLETELAKSLVQKTEFESQRIKKEEKEKCLEEKITYYQKQWILDCGKNTPLENCIALKQDITTLQDANVNINTSLSADNLYALRQQYKDKYAKSNCDKVFSDYALTQVSEIASKYQNIDNERIEAESKRTRNKRIFFGGLVLVASFVIINMLSKKK